MKWIKIRAHHVIVFSVCVSGKGFHTLQLCRLKGCSSSHSASTSGAGCHPFTVWSFAIITAWKWSSTWKTSTGGFLISHFYTVSDSPLKVNQMLCSINLTIFSYIYHPWVELFSVCTYSCRKAHSVILFEGSIMVADACNRFKLTAWLPIRAYCFFFFLSLQTAAVQWAKYSSKLRECFWRGKKTELGELICVFIYTCIKWLVLVM